MPTVSQLEFETERRGATQNQRVLARLQSSPGQWVAMPELARAGAANPEGFCMVHSRIADLRRAGHVIEQRSERDDGSRMVKSFYKLVIHDGTATEPNHG